MKTSSADLEPKGKVFKVGMVPKKQNGGMAGRGENTGGHQLKLEKWCGRRTEGRYVVGHMEQSLHGRIKG